DLVNFGIFEAWNTAVIGKNDIEVAKEMEKEIGIGEVAVARAYSTFLFVEK
ncbi:hypothetical protein KI387_037102, partial [Taxus chinensis]